MEKLSDTLDQLAQLAWQERLKGSSLQPSSLLFPFKEVMDKLARAQNQRIFDLATLKAAAAQDIFNHLERLAKRDGFGKGAKAMAACEAFVDGWFDTVLGDIYGGNVARLIGDEKLLRSAYLFFIRKQIVRKDGASDSDAEFEELED